MSEFTGAEIIGRRFHGGRRRGYDGIEVDRFLEEVAVYVDQLRARLADSQTTEFTAMEMLKGARHAADEMLLGSALAARNAEEELEQRRRRSEDEAKKVVAGARELAARIVEEARSESDRVRRQHQQDIAALDHVIEDRRSELASMTGFVTRLVHSSIDQLRESATSVTATADRLQVEILAKMDTVALESEADAV